MPTVAEQLKAARLARRLSVEHIASQTFMRREYVLAIEEGRYEVLGAPVYIKGFVRAYARAVGLDENQILRELAEELGQEKLCRPAETIYQNSQRVRYPRWVQWLREVEWEHLTPILTGITIGILAFVAVRMWQTNRQVNPVNLVPCELYRYGQDRQGIRIELIDPQTSQPRVVDQKD